ncbi:MAG: hypothetical protein ACK4SN_06450 [Bellilinea sp.]
MESPFPAFPVRMMVRHIRRMYRPFLIRPAHAYFLPAYFRPLPRRLRLCGLPDEEGGQLTPPVIASPEYNRFPL